MIYINNNSDNFVSTELLVYYIPSGVTVYFDENKIGDYLTDTGSTKTILKFQILKTDLDNVNLQNQDYVLKIYDLTKLIKIEQITLKSSVLIPPVVQYDNTIKYIQYNE